MWKHFSGMEYAWLTFAAGLLVFLVATSPNASGLLAGKDTAPVPQQRAVRPQGVPGPRAFSDQNVFGLRGVRPFKVILSDESDEKRANKPQTDEERSKLGEKLRKEYPYVSLQPRLAKLKRPSVPPDSAELDLTAYVEERPAERNGRGRRLPPYALQFALGKARSRSLELLHADSVDDFVEAQGFGVSRSPDLSYAPEHYIVLREEAAFFAEDIPAPLKTAKGTQVTAQWASTPSAERLMNVLAYHQDRFADVRSFGHVAKLDRVAGFRPHAFLVRPQLAFDEPPKPEAKESSWKVTRLQLVSLLMHDEPAVYVSKSLPRMSELAERPVTRELDDFEQSALAKLEAGENVVHRATLNRIEMVGAIRAVKHCLQCHEVERGALLGAFSYSLFRDPPVDASNEEEISVR